MCSNYEPVTRADRLLSFFDVQHKDAPSIVTWPTGLAPFIRLSELGRREAVDGHFGLLPHWAKELTYGRKTYNARSETVAVLASFKTAWRKGQRCVVPAECIFEPKFDKEGEKSERWRIQQPGEVPMGIAGVWTSWRNPKDGNEEFSFAMLTVNADGHPVMSQFHRPTEEKRMVVILEPADYDEWLTCSVEEAPRFFTRWAGPLDTYAAPLAPRKKKLASDAERPTHVDEETDGDDQEGDQPQLL